MKLSDVLVIYFTNIILRATSAYVPVVLMYHHDHSSLFFLAGFLPFLLVSLRKRKPVTAATSKTSTTSTTSTTTVSPEVCRVGYQRYAGPGRRFCYRLSSDCISWNEARAVCQMETANLISLDEQSIQPFSDVLKQQIPFDANGFCEEIQLVWLGATTDNTGGAIFIDGQRLSSNNPLWDINEQREPDKCVRFLFTPNRTYLLGDTCGIIAKYVCQQL